MRIFPAFSALLFLAFAVLQINDPDPWAWVGAYALASALCLAFALGWLPQKALFFAALAYLLLALYWWNFGLAGESCGEMFGKIPWPDFFAHEVVRESAGFFVCALGLGILGSEKKSA